MEAEIHLVYDDWREAKAISEAISPDNVKTPKDISIETTREKNRITTAIRYEGKNLRTLMSTIDDLLSCVSVAEKTFSAVKNLEK